MSLDGGAHRHEGGADDEFGRGDVFRTIEPGSAWRHAVGARARGGYFVIYFRYGALMIADVVSHLSSPADSISSQFYGSAYENGSRRRLFPAAREH